MTPDRETPAFDLTPDIAEADYLIGRFLVEALVALGGRAVPDDALGQWAHAAWTRSLAIAAESAEGAVAGVLAIHLARVARKSGRLAERLGLDADVVAGFLEEVPS